MLTFEGWIKHYFDLYCELEEMSFDFYALKKKGHPLNLRDFNAYELLKDYPFTIETLWLNHDWSTTVLQETNFLELIQKERLFNLKKNL